MRYINVEELKKLLDGEEVFALFDVRERAEYEAEQIFGASLLPRTSLERELPALVKHSGTKLVLYSNQENRAVLSAKTLEEGHYENVFVLKGGLDSWKQSGLYTVSGLHVMSKAFGELVAESFHETETVSPEVLKEWLSRKDDRTVVIEVRPEAEVNETGSIPGAINIPGVELVSRIHDYTAAGKRIVLTCAGRTRGFISCATVRTLRLGRVYDLLNGTMGWKLAGFSLSGDIPRIREKSPESEDTAKRAVSEIISENGIEFISSEELQSELREETAGNPVCLLDVRQKEEYLEGHIAGSRHYAGGEAIQDTDNACFLHNAKYVLISETGMRAAVVAYWYQRMGIPNVYVLNGGIIAWRNEGMPLAQAEPARLLIPASVPEGTEFVEAKDVWEMCSDKTRCQVLNIDDGRGYMKGHLKESLWIPRCRLEERLERVPVSRGTKLLITAWEETEERYAVQALYRMGYEKLAILSGGIASALEEKDLVSSGRDGIVPDDYIRKLTEYDDADARRYFAWERSLLNERSYMDYFIKKGIIDEADVISAE